MRFGDWRTACLSLGWCVIMLAFLAAGAPGAEVEQWGLCEAGLHAVLAAETSPTRVAFTATVLPGRPDESTVPGFWDGGGML